MFVKILCVEVLHSQESHWNARRIEMYIRILAPLTESRCDLKVNGKPMAKPVFVTSKKRRRPSDLPQRNFCEWNDRHRGHAFIEQCHALFFAR